MKRYIEIEATERAVNDPTLPKRTRDNSVERVIVFEELFRKHQIAVIKDAVEKGDTIYTMS